MTRKRTLHDLRQIAKKRQSEWWARCFDELFFMYLSGSRGVNADYIFPPRTPASPTTAHGAGHPTTSCSRRRRGTIPPTARPRSTSTASTAGTIDRLVTKAT
jgi:hypothetical protein